MAVTDFTVAVPDSTLDDLRDRLARTRWPDQVRDAGWAYGTDLSYLQELMRHWQTAFDWRSQEAAINGFPQVMVAVDDIELHAIHARGRQRENTPAPIPLLLLHGWPSSFVQMLDIIPMLTDRSARGDDAAVTFDVVALSLPGFAFSSRPPERGMSVARIADLANAVMGELGYPRYAVRGSDLGAGVATQLALAVPDAVIGVHTGGTNPWIQDVPDDLSPAERKFVANAQRWSQEEMAYAMLHGSRPQTLAYALNDSPAGLAGWIIEKFWRWSDHDSDLETAIPRDALLTNLTVYWVTQTIGSSMRLYYETMRDPGRWGQPSVPVAMAMPVRDMFPTPREWAERTSRVDRWTEFSRGGHFLEWEQPEPLARDIREFFATLR